MKLVLMGAKEGGWCAIDTVRQPVLRVSGLQSGAVDFKVLDSGRNELFGGVTADGDYDLTAWFGGPRSEQLCWIKLSSTDPTPDLVCTVVNKAA